MATSPEQILLDLQEKINDVAYKMQEISNIINKLLLIMGTKK